MKTLIEQIKEALNTNPNRLLHELVAYSLFKTEVQGRYMETRAPLELVRDIADKAGDIDGITIHADNGMMFLLRVIDDVVTILVDGGHKSAQPIKVILNADEKEEYQHPELFEGYFTSGIFKPDLDCWESYCQPYLRWVLSLRPIRVLDGHHARDHHLFHFRGRWGCHSVVKNMVGVRNYKGERLRIEELLTLDQWTDFAIEVLRLQSRGHSPLDFEFDFNNPMVQNCIGERLLSKSDVFDATPKIYNVRGVEWTLSHCLSKDKKESRIIFHPVGLVSSEVH